MNITIHHTIYRDDDETVIDLECTGSFYRGGFEGFNISAPHAGVILTDNEEIAITDALMQAKVDDYDE